ncbi:hypothetical protein EDD86DRAFT_193467 [Gorgonomyces haynaldii]|nr:hypothetical protein EDD86DRAFT_193467 [Gorgonomyces haynaldii]
MQRLVIRVQKRNVGFLQVLSDSIRRQVQENKDFQKNVQLLGETSSKIQDSNTVKQAQEAAKKTSEATAQVMNAVGQVVEKTIENPVVKATGKVLYHSAQAVGTVTQKVAEPILDTQVAKTIGQGIEQIKKDVIDSSDNAFYQEYLPKEVRQKLKEEKKKSMKMVNGLPVMDGPVQADVNAGSGLIMHQSSRLQAMWKKFKEDSDLGQRLFGYTRSMEESGNPLVDRLRGMRDMTRFDESEKAKIIRMIRDYEPSFTEHRFLKEATQFIVPELIEGWISSDLEILRQWCGEKAIAKFEAEVEYQTKNGLKNDSKLLDIYDVMIQRMELVEDTLPVIVIACQADEVLMFKDKTGAIVAGSEDNITRARYVFVFSKQQIVEPEAEFNQETNGWLCIDMARG